jgi:uncharacterized membrane protein YhhN
MTFSPTTTYFSPPIFGIPYQISYVNSKAEKKLWFPLFIYGIVIGAFFICAAQILFNNKSSGAAMIFFGSICFVISDAILAYYALRGRAREAAFAVMLTYIAAQAALIAGFAGGAL